MRDAEQRRSLAVAVNQVAFVSFDYPGHETFFAEALPMISVALERIKPQQLNGVTYRYENELGLARDELGGLLLDSTFPGIVPGVFAGSPSRAMNALYEHAWNEDDLRGLRGFHARVEEERGVAVMKLGVFGCIEGPDLTDLGQASHAAHRAGLELFESLISEDFREFISSSKD
jgi:uncharacterized protein (TIGR04255 family)